MINRNIERYLEQWSYMTAETDARRLRRKNRTLLDAAIAESKKKKAAMNDHG